MKSGQPPYEWAFDHVALASSRAGADLTAFVHETGARVLYGREAVGMRWVLTHAGESKQDLTVEFLEPWAVTANDFLQRFVTSRTAAPHHLTFTTPDLLDALDECERHSYRVHSVDLSNPEWLEAFLHPRDAHGTLIQLAQSASLSSAGLRTRTPDGQPWWPPVAGRAGLGRTRLTTVEVAVPDISEALVLYAGVLHGQVVHSDDEGAELRWDSGGSVRLVRDHTATPAIRRITGYGDCAARMVIAGTPIEISPAAAG